MSMLDKLLSRKQEIHKHLENFKTILKERRLNFNHHHMSIEFDKETDDELRETIRERMISFTKELNRIDDKISAINELLAGA